ncbi:DUF4932 domain-containing protein [Flavobacterium piscinae]|uniref:DUF4932 domain-containing protein n=1 Tax=Flavobacterium piscinae TaxID=2506424 RepID=A0A4V1N587_9FLAO|nr:DUF4932 domain-containing protein [Flavobacterium piscinae]RXR34806.1 DUF4932 domain-containing protein [Flavobacterium piscinae]
MNQKFFLVTVFFLISLGSFSQKQQKLQKPYVDERVELLSIIFRLAESEEYSSNLFKKYTDKIYNHYNLYKNHELIDFIKKIRNENGVSYDAVMSMAIHLDKNFNPIVPFSDTIPDVRWGKGNAYKFIELLHLFYKDSNSKDFFKQNENFYENISDSFLPIFNKLNAGWYKSFYGKEANESFKIIIGLGIGGGNYGPSVTLKNGEKEVYAIMGTWNTNHEGMPEFKISSYFPTLVHEFNHSFINYILEKNENPFKESCQTLFLSVKDKMNQGGYGDWQTLFNEALVRAAVIKYMKDNNFTIEEINLEINEQLNRGFVWIEDLVSKLEEYDTNRKQYPTLESYYPILADSYKEYAKNIDKMILKVEKLKPRLVSISEFNNGDTNVNSNLKQITLNFDKPFSEVNFLRPTDENAAFPEFTNLTYSENRESITLTCNLNANTEYKMVLVGLSPRSISEIPQDYIISFKTEK